MDPFQQRAHLWRDDSGKLPGGVHEEVDVHARVVGGPQLRVREQEVQARRLEGGEHEGRVGRRRVARPAPVVVGAVVLQELDVERLVLERRLQLREGGAAWEQWHKVILWQQEYKVQLKYDLYYGLCDPTSL